MIDALPHGTAEFVTGGNSNATRYFPRGACDQVIDKKFYQICYDYRMRAARYVAYELDGQKVNARNIKKRPRFYPESRIPRQFRAYPSDYTRNPYHMDRGHLAPDASFDWSVRSLKAVYSMANIIPQYYLINRKMWSKAERYERLMATKLGHVTVVNGVVYDRHPKRIGQTGVAVPDAFWKAIIGDNGFRRCFWYDNRPVSKAEAKRDRLRSHVIDCNRVLH